MNGSKVEEEEDMIHGGERDSHPASDRPSGLTAAEGLRTLSIIINPLESGMGGRGPPPSSPSPPPIVVVRRDEEAPEDESEISPPPSYHDIPGTVPAHQGVSRGPPPSYEDAVDPNAEPPSYDSLFGRIRDTHKSSKNFCDFLAKFVLLLMGTIGCTIAYSITVVIPVCMIVIGSLYFNQCPAEPCIPVFLIVGGSFSVSKYLIGVMTRTRREDNQEYSRSHPAQLFITFCLCGWFIIGCVWVYRIYWPKFEPQRPGDINYCDKTVYFLAYWIITTTYICLGTFTSCFFCSSIVAVILKREV